jgi:adenylate cyclase
LNSQHFPDEFGLGKYLLAIWSFMSASMVVLGGLLNGLSISVDPAGLWQTKARLLCSRLLFGGLLLGILPLSAQNQNLLDSLERRLTQEDYSPKEYFEILQQLGAGHTDPDKILTYSGLLIEGAQEVDSLEYLVRGLIDRGDALRLKSDLSQALESYFEAAKIASESDVDINAGLVYVTIADVYSIIGNHPNASKYYKDAIAVLRQARDSINLASALLNVGDEFFIYGDLDSALLFFQESEAIFRDLEYDLGVAYNRGNIGMIYAEQGRKGEADAYLQQAIDYLEQLEDYYPVSVYLLYLADVAVQQNRLMKAIAYAKKSLQLATEYGLKEQISEANLKLSEIYQRQGNFAKALDHFQTHISFRDSIRNIETVQRMATLRTDYEVSQKQTEIDLLEKEAEIQHLRESRQRRLTYASSIALLSIILLAVGLYRRYRYIQRTNDIIQEERNRSDILLRNILPAETALELKQRGRVRAKKFDSVTVLFSDFIGFTNYASNLSPEKLVESIDFYFSEFDKIMEKHNLEKIKTVGDAYMCAGGLPFITHDHAQKMVLAAFDMIEFVESVKSRKDDSIAHFDVRIGINTGPVVAGVVGTKKFAYDIWGDTVNIAARMETSGSPSRINISEKTHAEIKNEFDCEYRGVMDVRNKGRMKMYYVTGIKDERLVFNWWERS